MSTWKVILATLVIYAAGLVTGALVMKSSRPAKDLSPPPPWIFQGPEFVQKRFLERMQKELELVPEQVKRLEAVMRDSREKTKSWWEIVGPEFQAELKETQEKIRAELNSTQREKFEKLLKDRRRPPGGVPGGDRRPRDHHSNAPRSSLQGTNPVPPPTSLPRLPMPSSGR